MGMYSQSARKRLFCQIGLPQFLEQDAQTVDRVEMSWLDRQRALYVMQGKTIALLPEKRDRPQMPSLGKVWRMIDRGAQMRDGCRHVPRLDRVLSAPQQEIHRGRPGPRQFEFDLCGNLARLRRFGLRKLGKQPIQPRLLCQRR